VNFPECKLTDLIVSEFPLQIIGGAASSAAAHVGGVLSQQSGGEKSSGRGAGAEPRSGGGAGIACSAPLAALAAGAASTPKHGDDWRSFLCGVTLTI
jgi:hypothetical protein